MRRRRALPACALLALLLLAFPVAGAWQTADLPVAAITDGNVWLYALNGQGRRLTNARTGETFNDVIWSPDGSLLTFTGEVEGRQGASLFVASEGGGPLVELVGGLHPMLPVSFTPDSAELVYAQTVPGASTSTSDLVQVYRYSPLAGAAPTPIGTFTAVTACNPPPGPALPGAARLGSEVGSRLTPRYTLAATTFGVLYSANCNNPDLWLMNMNTGATRQLFASVDGVFVARDGTRAVVVMGNTLVFVSSEAGPYTQIVPAARPDQVAFGLPGSREVFYSTRESLGPTPLPEGVGEMLSSVYFQMPVSYHVSIRRFSLETGRDELLYEADAYGIGRMALTPDGETLLFSQTPNADIWLDALAHGDVAADDTEAALRLTPIEVYALSLADGSVRKLGENWNNFALNPAADVTFTPASSLMPVEPTFTPVPLLPTETLPPTLTPPPEGFIQPTLSPSGIGIGLEMRISREVGTLNVRRNPGTGSPVVELMFGGERVTVIDGPQDDLEGFRWWKVTLPSGAVGWVAERVNGIQTLVPPE
ncbi:MAG: SH3 domain-containing protein [Chloroflexota bacterium]|nr:MAG: hypothetical protein DIU68_17145 [Chloroflexota bacterium]